MKCPNCNKDLSEDAKFCNFCGTVVTQTEAYETAQNNTQNSSSKKKKSGKNVVIIILSILLVIAIIVGGIFFFKWREKEENEVKEKEATEILTEVLKESTSKPIVEMICKDYDNNGTYEAYAIVGETDEKGADHPEFYDADIYFVNEKKAQPIKENVSGKVNGTIELEEIIYISIEVYDEDSDEGKSFIYTVEDNKTAESEISGKYSNVHEENGEVVGTDENGEEVKIEIIEEETTVEYVTELTEENDVTENKESTTLTSNEEEDEITKTSTTKKTATTKKKETTTKKSENNNSSYNFSNAKVGDYIKFGSYEQDNNTSNGKEAIEWLVLDKKDGKILVISKYALDCQPYHEKNELITWEDCTLRKWLNNEFVKTAFTSTQRSMIPTVTVKAEDNYYFETEAGNDTQDKVFLLSISEAETYFASDSLRKCKSTVYAEAQGAYVYEQNCFWRLRSPGVSQEAAADVESGGGISEGGFGVAQNYYAVRPAMWINL